jgi:hypothetical protein
LLAIFCTLWFCFFAPLVPTRLQLQSGGALSSLVFESIADGKAKGGIDADMAQVPVI